MSSDESDKTVFWKPAGADNTIVRPTPGGGRRSTSQSAPVYQPSVPEMRGDKLAVLDPGPQPVYSRPEYSLNPLVAAASALLVVFEKTRVSPSHPNVVGLYQRLVVEIKSFEAQIRGSGIKSEIALTARYVLCTALDEAVLNTPWGGESKWPQQTLLSTFHGETSGGEKFFLIL